MDSHTAFYFPPSANKDRAVKGASFCKLSFSQISYSYVFVKWKKCNILPSFLLIHIVDSTFHHPPGVGWSPSLSREGNVSHASVNQLLHSCPLQEQNIPLHTVPNSIGICRQQTKFATFTLSLQRGKRVAVFPLVQLLLVNDSARYSRKQQIYIF